MEFKKETVIFLENERNEKYAKVVIKEEGNDVYNIIHTYVSEDHRGEGLAGKLVAEAVSYIKSMNGKILPGCSYAEVYCKKNNIEFIQTDKGSSCSIAHMKED